MLFQLIVTFALCFCLSESFGRCCAVCYYNPRVTTLLTVRKTWIIASACTCCLILDVGIPVAQTGRFLKPVCSSIMPFSCVQVCFYFLCKAYFSLIFFSTFPSYFHLRDARICHAWSKCRWSFLHCPPEPETRSVWPNSCSGFKVLGWRKDCPCQIFPLLRPHREVLICLCINILFYLRLYAYRPALAVLFMALCL